MLKAKCKQVIISENSLFDDAFEGAFIGEHEDWFVTKMDVSNDSDKKEYLVIMHFEVIMRDSEPFSAQKKVKMEMPSFKNLRRLIMANTALRAEKAKEIIFISDDTRRNIKSI